MLKNVRNDAEGREDEDETLDVAWKGVQRALRDQEERLSSTDGLRAPRRRFGGEENAEKEPV